MKNHPLEWRASGGQSPTASTPFTAVVLAGDRAPDDPVAQAAGVCCKALSPVGGIPMVLRVLKALGTAREIDTHILCGPPWSAVEQEAELQARITSRQVTWMANEASPSASAYAVMQALPETTPVLLTTADHALLTTRIVDFFCAEARTSGCDMVVALAPHDLVTTTYPGVRRTVLTFREGAYCSCNLFAFLTPRARAVADFWRRVERQRKKPLRVIGVLGWVALWRYWLGRLSLTEGLDQISRRMGLRVGTVIMPFPEAAVDVDTVSDWRFAEKLVGD